MTWAANWSTQQLVLARVFICYTYMLLENLSPQKLLSNTSNFLCERLKSIFATTYIPNTKIDYAGRYISPG